MCSTLLDAEGFTKLGTITWDPHSIQWHKKYHSMAVQQFHANSTTVSGYIDAEFFIADAIGLPNSRALNLVMLNCAICTTAMPTPKVANLRPIHNKGNLKAQYPDRFTGIGQFHITLHEDALPTVHQQCKYIALSFQKRQDVMDYFIHSALIQWPLCVTRFNRSLGYSCKTYANIATVDVIKILVDSLNKSHQMILHKPLLTVSCCLSLWRTMWQ